MLQTRTRPRGAGGGSGETGAGADAPRLRVAPDEPAALAILSAMAEGLHWLRENEPAALRGDATGVHHLRTTTRRLRTVLGLCGGLIEPARAGGLAADLKWLAAALGAVRDLDVLTDRLRASADGGAWAEALGPLFAAFDARHAAASDALQAGMRSERYAGLLARLAAAPGGLPLTEAAGEPCRTALPALVRGLWERLRRGARALTPDDPDDRFHEVRKRAKRARYAAEAVVPSLDPGPAAAARRFARLARSVQDVLGAHQDAVIAASEVRDAAAAHPDLGPFNFAAGRLLEREHRTAADARAAFFGAWDGLDRKKVTRWLKP